MDREPGQNVCANAPFTDQQIRDVVPFRDTFLSNLLLALPGRTALRGLARGQDNEQRGPLARARWPNPLEAYQMLFFEQLDPYIVRAVSRLYARQRQQNDRLLARVREGALPETAFLYVFRDASDPFGVVKIGSTTRTARARVGEWRARLGADGQHAHVTLLFWQSVPGHLLHFAERVVHALLTCQWVAGRVDRERALRLTEFFRVENLQNLRFLLQACVLHANATFSGPV